MQILLLSQDSHAFSTNQGQDPLSNASSSFAHNRSMCKVWIQPHMHSRFSHALVVLCTKSNIQLHKNLHEDFSSFHFLLFFLCQFKFIIFVKPYLTLFNYEVSRVCHIFDG